MSGTSWQGHTFYVNLVRWDEVAPGYGTTLSAPGPYRLSGIAPGDYRLMVVLDMDDSGSEMLTAGDTSVLYGAGTQQERITLTAGQELSAIDVTLISLQRQMNVTIVGGVACTPAPGVNLGSISGTVTASPTSLPAGQIYVNLRLPDGSSGEYLTKLDQPGSFTFSGVADGTYLVIAFLDVDNSGPTTETSPDWVGWFGGGPDSVKTVTISGGCAVTGVDIAISGISIQSATTPTPTSGPTAAATATSAGAGGTTGTISGTLSIARQCADGSVHTIFVNAIPVGSGPPGYMTRLTAPGSYALSDLPPGRYNVGAVMDCNDGPSPSGDVSGMAGPTVSVTAGSETSGVDFALSALSP